MCDQVWNLVCRMRLNSFLSQIPSHLTWFHSLKTVSFLWETAGSWSAIECVSSLVLLFPCTRSASICSVPAVCQTWPGLGGPGVEDSSDDQTNHHVFWCVWQPRRTESVCHDGSWQEPPTCSRTNTNLPATEVFWILIPSNLTFPP